MNAGYLTLIFAVAPVFLIIAAGYLIRRAGWLSAEADSSLMQVIVNLLFPCLILDTIVGNRALENAGNVLLAPLAGFVTIVAGYALSYATAPLFGLRSQPERRTFAFTTGMYNYGYVPLPLIKTLFDPATTAVLFIHNIGVEAALWTVGIALLCRRDKVDARRGWLHIFNAPVVAIILAIALHFAAGRTWIPAFAWHAIAMLGAAAIPLGLILTGATFADQMRQLGAVNGHAVAIGSGVLRLAVLPALMIGLAIVYPWPVELRRVILIQAAMPCAVIPVILAKHYGGEPAVAMRIVLVTSALGVVTIPLWLHVGLRYLG